MPGKSDDQPGAAASARHRPQQSRSQETYEALLEAAARLYADQGYEQTTTHQVAAAAGVSVGALYRYFHGKQAILEQLYHRQVTGLRERALREFSLSDLVGSDLTQLLRKTLGLVVRTYAEQPGLQRVLGEQARKIPELARLRRELEAEVHLAVQSILQSAPGINVPDPEVGAYLVTVFIEGLMDDLVLHRGSGQIPGGDQQRVINAATDMVLRYVVRPPQRSRDSEPER